MNTTRGGNFPSSLGRIASFLRPNSLSLLVKVLEAGGVEVATVVLPDGEGFKSLEVLTKILDKAIFSRLDRKCTFVALGGGVIGDMVGFAAAIYQRGVKFVQACLLRGRGGKGLRVEKDGGRAQILMNLRQDGTAIRASEKAPCRNVSSSTF